MSLLKSLLNSKRFLLNVEMCPPRMDLPLEQSIEAWIDSNHLMRKIASLGRFVFMTDGAIGRREEPNLRHVTINLARRSGVWFVRHGTLVEEGQPYASPLCKTRAS